MGAIAGTLHSGRANRSRRDRYRLRDRDISLRTIADSVVVSDGMLRGGGRKRRGARRSGNLIDVALNSWIRRDCRGRTNRD